jgi:NADPH-dependent 2,4-dienoyl-CoA reductase/sulfur reductase-like enzyme
MMLRWAGWMPRLLCTCLSQQVRVLGWPLWMVQQKMSDPETSWPMTCGFKPCAKTMVLEDDDAGPRAVGQKAVVVGGSKGIGLAIAHVLAQEGADVALIAKGR